MGLSSLFSSLIKLVIIMKFLTKNLVNSALFKRVKSHFNIGKTFFVYLWCKKKTAVLFSAGQDNLT